MAVDAWNAQQGEVVSEKVLFYSLDEFATVLFFSLTTILALFWAELYHIATDSADFFNNIIRPATYLLNFVALVGVALCTYYVTTSYATDVDYIFIQYTLLVATAYFLSALMFGYYAYLADIELKQVPIQLSMRQNRILFLRILGFICITALLAQAVILIIITGKVLFTTSAAELSAVFFYFFLLELLPIGVILIYYRVEDAEEIEEEHDGSEVASLLFPTPSSERNNSPRIMQSPILRSLPKYHPQSAPNSVVDAVIARLSDNESSVVSGNISHAHSHDGSSFVGSSFAGSYTR